MDDLIGRNCRVADVEPASIHAANIRVIPGGDRETPGVRGPTVHLADSHARPNAGLSTAGRSLDRNIEKLVDSQPNATAPVRAAQLRSDANTPLDASGAAVCSVPSIVSGVERSRCCQRWNQGGAVREAGRGGYAFRVDVPRHSADTGGLKQSHQGLISMVTSMRPGTCRDPKQHLPPARFRPASGRFLMSTVAPSSLPGSHMQCTSPI
jgi:hypothetical protein